MHTLKLFASAMAIGMALDYVWFSLLASGLYKREISQLLRMSDGAIAPNLWAALLVYVLIAALVVLFVVPKASSLGAAALWGALAGLILYGVYDLTNMSFLKDWTWAAALPDIAWGTFMVGVLSAALWQLDKALS